MENTDKRGLWHTYTEWLNFCVRLSVCVCVNDMTVWPGVCLWVYSGSLYLSPPICQERAPGWKMEDLMKAYSSYELWWKEAWENPNTFQLNQLQHPSTRRKNSHPAWTRGHFNYSVFVWRRKGKRTHFHPASDQSSTSIIPDLPNIIMIFLPELLHFGIHNVMYSVIEWWRMKSYNFRLMKPSNLLSISTNDQLHQLWPNMGHLYDSV